MPGLERLTRLREDLSASFERISVETSVDAPHVDGDGDLLDVFSDAVDDFGIVVFLGCEDELRELSPLRRWPPMLPSWPPLGLLHVRQSGGVYRPFSADVSVPKTPVGLNDWFPAIWTLSV